MTNKERAMAILTYGSYDRIPIVHFGFWAETLQKWHHEGHLTSEEASQWYDGGLIDDSIGQKLGFDFNWFNCVGSFSILDPPFTQEVIEESPDGSRKVLNSEGVVILQKNGAISIPLEIDHLLKDRDGWEKFYLQRLQFSEERLLGLMVNTGAKSVKFSCGGLEYLKKSSRGNPVGLFCGSLFGEIRNWLGLEGVSYLYFDDEKLFDEIIQVVADLRFKVVEKILAMGAKFDFAHFWEDICAKNGPLIMPSVFNEKIGPYYNKFSKLLTKYGITIISLDCDGFIDPLIPTWLDNGINTMFPIEVGTWNASIRPWRKKYGRELRGVGGMNKNVFSQDYAAIDAEIERLRALVDLGGYIPCPDHRIAPDAKWKNVQYYCNKMRQIFSA
jgi:hypothetical protein